MHSRVLVLLLAVVAAAALMDRQPGGCACGSNYYTSTDIYNAVSQAESGSAGQVT